MKRPCLQSNCTSPISIAGGIDGKDLIRLVEKVRNSLCD
ncbi:hypothetical protein Godav_010159 [Gossypium davidsonii]|uniref:Uncharacterized protein n=1 Tax=Gossypium davidsonii TaxID=34287 RepID=A0A7J8SFN5_GOSDV|nr:hypothetical protein [Gossypium davidsonii]